MVIIAYHARIIYHYDIHIASNIPLRSIIVSTVLFCRVEDYAAFMLLPFSGPPPCLSRHHYSSCLENFAGVP